MGQHDFSAPPANNSLTLVSYLAGARYKFRQPWLEGNHKPQPVAQIIFGATHEQAARLVLPTGLTSLRLGSVAALTSP